MDEILKVDRRWRPDLIVIGTHGRGGVRRFLMGSVAEHVVRRGRRAAGEPDRVQQAERDRERGGNGRPEYVRQSIEGSLRRLGVDHIDLATAVEARKTAPRNYVTKAMREVEYSLI